MSDKRKERKRCNVILFEIVYTHGEEVLWYLRYPLTTRVSRLMYTTYTHNIGSTVGILCRVM